MASSGNFCTMNPIGQVGGSDNTSKIFENGNLQVRNFQYFDATVMGTVGVTSGKWYYEVTLESSSASSGQAWGWCNSRFNIDAGLSYTNPASATGGDTIHIYADGSPMRVTSGVHNESNSNWADTDANFSTSNIIGIAVDFDNSKAYFSQDGSFTNVRSGQDPANGTNPCLAPSGGLYTWNLTADNIKKYGPWYPAIGNWSAASRTVRVNFGQDSTFQGQVSAGGNADENGFGDFKYSVPAGFLAICTGNLPVDADIDPAQTDADFPGKQFNAVAYTGTGSTRSVSGLNFQPDMLWLKCRSDGQSARLIDSSRGVSKTLTPADSQTEQTESNGITSFDSDGFTIGSSTGGFNTSSATYVGWAWRCNGGTTASNSDGAISSVVQANTKSGFSITTFTGLASSNFSSTVGHGLNAAPEFIIHKALDTAGSWWCSHVGLSAVTKFLAIDSNGAEVNLSSYGSISAPTSSVFSVNGVEGIGGGGSARSYIAYCWHSVVGYSSFGTYVGNASDDGPYIHTGFRPRMVFVKNTEQSGTEWSINDSARNTFNPTEKQLNWDNDNAEVTGKNIDFLSNGFKIRKNTGAMNNDDRVHIYGAWADVPFKYNNTF